MASDETTGYRVALYTMGCRTNQYDSSRMAAEFEAAGFRLVPFDEPADVYVINTCTVTAEADREARRASRRALERCPQAVVVATGCYVQVDPSPMRQLSGIRLVGGNDLKSGIVERVRELLPNVPFSPESLPPPVRDRRSPGGSRVHRTRQVIKIQEGCNFRCGYCVVPHARGRARSRPLAVILEEVRRYADAGCREIVLTGTCIGSFGSDLSPRSTLADCAAAVAAIPGILRVRISSIEPWDVDEDLIDLAATNNILCPHFHLPLQSGDDGVRRRMRRPGTSAQFAGLVQRIRERLPEAGITTDVIAGYPSETDAEFAATRDFCRQMQFSRMHVFRYSPRPFTHAEKLDGQIAPAVRESRSRDLIRIGTAMSDAFARRWLGKTVSVLVEGPQDPGGLLEGLTPNYLRARFPGEERLRGTLADVRALRVEDGCLLGEIVTEG